MNGLTLYELTAAQAQIEQELMENGGELTPEIEAQLAEVGDALALKGDNYFRLLKTFECVEDAADKEIKRLQGLKKTAQNSQKNLRSHLQRAMVDNGIDRIDTQLCKFSLKHTTAVEFEEGFMDQFSDLHERLTEQVPEWVNVELKVSKTELRKAIEQGTPILGAQIVNNVSLIIK